MSFPQAIKSGLSKYATFAGRAGRAEYWWFALFYLLVYVVAIVIDNALRPFLIRKPWTVTDSRRGRPDSFVSVSREILMGSSSGTSCSSSSEMPCAAGRTLCEM